MILGDEELARCGERGLVGDVLSKYWDGCVPVRPVSVAARLGWEVWRAEELGEGVAAHVDPEARRITTLNSHALPRFRFAVAHALGRILRDSPAKPFDILLSDFQLGATGRSSEANTFAGRLLAPKLALEHLIRTEAELGALARRFQVSEVLMKHRLEQAIF